MNRSDFCKTSIPGSNPGGASILFNNSQVGLGAWPPDGRAAVPGIVPRTVRRLSQEGWQDHAAGFPDGRLEVTSSYDDGDVAITGLVLRGTHGGTWAGIAPT